MQNLVGRAVAMIGDARGNSRHDPHVVVERILTITGENAITVDRKYKEPWDGRLGVRLIYVTNVPPKLKDPSGVIVHPVAEIVQVSPKSKLTWVVATALPATIVGLIVWFLTQSVVQPTVRLTAVHPGTESVGLANDTDVVLSPDGTRLVYATGGAAEGQFTSVP